MYVGLSVTVVSHAKSAEPIELPFGLWTGLGPRNHVRDGVQKPHPNGNIKRDKGRPIVEYRDSLL